MGKIEVTHEKIDGLARELEEIYKPEAKYYGFFLQGFKELEPGDVENRKKLGILLRYTFWEEGGSDEPEKDETSQVTKYLIQLRLTQLRLAYGEIGPEEAEAVWEEINSRDRRELLIDEIETGESFKQKFARMTWKLTNLDTKTKRNHE